MFRLISRQLIVLVETPHFFRIERVPTTIQRRAISLPGTYGANDASGNPEFRSKLCDECVNGETLDNLKETIRRSRCFAQFPLAQFANRSARTPLPALGALAATRGGPPTLQKTQP